MSVTTDLRRLDELLESLLPGQGSTRSIAARSSPFDVNTAAVMIVDDDRFSADVISAHLHEDGYTDIFTVDDATCALQTARARHPDVILLDLHMPHVGGLEVLSGLRADENLTIVPVVILTAETEHDTKLRALELGATDFLQKPIHGGELRARLRNILMAKAFQDGLRNSAQLLEAAVRQRTAELDTSRREVVHCLARAAEMRDEDTGRHVLRVGRYARAIGAQLGLEPSFLDMLEQATQLHDIGKIGIPDSILLKPGKLTEEEFREMQKHCTFGSNIVQPLAAMSSTGGGESNTEPTCEPSGRSPLLEMATRIAMTHHEWWDGSGYPLGLKGEAIPLEGRITAVADVFDALSSKRPYKPAFPAEKCWSIIREESGTHFDPAVVDAFVARRREIEWIQHELMKCS
jgi:putative two-component system response regulator